MAIEHPPYQRGVFNMTCFNALGGSLQRRLVYHGNLPMGYVPVGWCHNPAEVEVTTVWDEMPGPRFYCIGCAIQYLINMKGHHDADDSDGITGNADLDEAAVRGGGAGDVRPGDLQHLEGHHAPTASGPHSQGQDASHQ